MSAKLTTHTPVAMPTMTLFLFQMAKLEGSISTVVMQKRRKLTCEARLIANLSQRPGSQKSRHMNKTERYQGNDIDAHEGGSDHCLASGSGIVDRGRSVRVRKVDAVHWIHLAVTWSRIKKRDHV